MPRGTTNPNELNLLAEALSTQGESEGDGVKYIYMDEQTVYRFENNRMKKVSAAMIKKANKLLETQGVLPNDTPENLKPKQPRQVRTKAKANKVIPGMVAQDVEEDTELPPEDDDEEDAVPPPKPVSKAKAPAKAKTTRVKADSAANIDLNEYYNNKNKMEYMTLEIDRLNNKISKLKQYKSIVNKITGGEYDPDIQVPIPQQQYQQQAPQQYPQQYPNQGAGGRVVNDSLFSFNGF